MVSDTVGPNDQKRLGHTNHCEISELSKPPDALSVTVGYQAATATPIWAFAEATWRSAAATSGRRSSNSDGRPAGTKGGVCVSGSAAIEKVDAGTPINTAIACSSCARCTPS